MRNTIYLVVMLLFLAGCEKEDVLTPSKEDRDWFVITNDSDAPVDKAIYALYEKWHIPVFYNDTIGREERGVDYKGNPIVYYRVLNLNYSLNSSSNYNTNERRISKVESESDLLAGVRFLDEVLLPNMPDVFHFTSVLLLDSLYEVSWGRPVLPLLEVYQGMEVLAIGNVPSIARMERDEQVDVVNRVVTYLTVNYLTTKNLDKMSDFYKVSYDPVKEWEYHGMYVTPTPLYPGYVCLASARWETYGFLGYDHSRYSKLDPSPVEEWSYYLPKKDADVEDFILAVLSYTPDEFETEYAEFPKVKEKYTLMREMLVEQGIVK
ncbi:MULTISPECIES: hypothetical protein [Butyricimonas]|jgi:lipoprotein|uniref:hypothetical protein n=1 Tax=Butyricimonas virosa TaxID=544645 RepID=UPI003CFD91BE